MWRVVLLDLRIKRRFIGGVSRKGFDGRQGIERFL